MDGRAEGAVHTGGSQSVGAAVAAAPTITVVGSSKLGAMPGSQAGPDVFQPNE